MVKPLDGIALLAYCHRLKLSKETQNVLIDIRESPPSRTPSARRGNMPVWYPSKKIQCTIKAESAKVEFAFLLEAEHADDVLEFWDQPPPIPLAYLDKRGHLQRPFHTADYFVFRQQSAGYEECKPVEELARLAQTQPNRYRQDELGTWRCLPGEAFAAKHGLTYRVRASNQINWAAQDNWLYLDDYYQDLEHLALPEAVLDLLWQIVEEHPGLRLADLRAVASEASSDQINIAIAQHALSVDLATHRLSESWRTPVWRSRQIALAVASPQKLSQEAATLSEKHSLLTPTGRELREQASEITPWQIMNGKLDSLGRVVREGRCKSSPLPPHPTRRVDREECLRQLRAALSENVAPPSLRQVARRLGHTSTSRLTEHFPEECAVVAQRKKQRLLKIREDIQQVVFALHAQGEYPLIYKLSPFFPNGLMRQREAIEAWREAMQELGLEP